MSNLLKIRNLIISYAQGAIEIGPIDLDIDAGTIYGLVGESGGGKSTLARAILNDLPSAAHISQGTIALDGQAIHGQDANLWRKLRWKQLAYIPQNALNALNPVRRIKAQFFDILKSHPEMWHRQNWHMHLVDVLSTMRLEEDVLQKFPHELSGGMRQRVCIAMAILFKPKLIIADEPTSALDVVSQHVVLQSLMAIRERFSTTILLIGHDMAIMAQIADEVGILFGGQLVESGAVTDIFSHARHDYTKRLLDSVFSIRARRALPEPSIPTPAEQKHWQDRSIPMRQLSANHQARVV